MKFLPLVAIIGIGASTSIDGASSTTTTLNEEQSSSTSSLLRKRSSRQLYQETVSNYVDPKSQFIKQAQMVEAEANQLEEDIEKLKEMEADIQETTAATDGGGGATNEEQQQADEAQEEVANGERLQPDEETAADTTQTQSQSSNQPNILFLLLDQWRPDWDGHHPDTPTGPLPLNMRFLTEISQRGTRFTQAYVPSPFCGPSRACLAFGKEYDATGVPDNSRWTEDHTTWTTVYKLLRDEGGYHTMTCGKDDFYEWDEHFSKYPGMEPRNMPLADLGFADAIRSDGKIRVTKDSDRLNEAYRTFLESTTVTTKDGRTIGARAAYKDCMEEPINAHGKCDAKSFPNEIYPDDFVKDRAIELLDRKPQGKPWFLQVNFPGPHHPVVSTSRMAASVMDRQWPDPINNPGWGRCPQQIEKYARGVSHFEVPPMADGRCNYAAELENLDLLMFTIVKHVEDMGDLENTIVIIAGDHGENLGDNGEVGKGMPWHASVSTPLFMFGPGLNQGQVYDGPVTTLDLGGTWLDFAGVNNLAPGMTTSSLRSILTANENVPRRLTVNTGYVDWRAVIQEMPTSAEDQTMTSYKLICCTGKERLTPDGQVMYDRGFCKGAPSTATPYPTDKPWQLMLYDTMRDPHDMEPLEDSRPDVVQELVQLLPEGWCR